MGSEGVSRSRAQVHAIQMAGSADSSVLADAVDRGSAAPITVPCLESVGGRRSAPRKASPGGRVVPLPRSLPG